MKTVENEHCPKLHLHRLHQLFAIQRKMDDWARNLSLFTIDTSNKKPEAVAAEIVEWTSKRN